MCLLQLEWFVVSLLPLAVYIAKMKIKIKEKLLICSIYGWVHIDKTVFKLSQLCIPLILFFFFLSIKRNIQDPSVTNLRNTIGSNG